MYHLCNYKIYNNLKGGVLETTLYDQVLILCMDDSTETVEVK